MKNSIRLFFSLITHRIPVGYTKNKTFATSLIIIDLYISICGAHQPPSRDISAAKPYLLVNHPDYPAGMFSVFNTVVGFLDLYEAGAFGGITVDFEDKGLYYMQEYGNNWWEYYCEPIRTENLFNLPVKTASRNENMTKALYTEFKLSRQRVYDLFQRYIEFKPHIVKKSEDFIQAHFKSPVMIGVHYRGTDKYCEAPPVKYLEMIFLILRHVIARDLHDYQIFVATDEQGFLDFIHEAFPGKIVCLEMLRATHSEPLHINNSNPYLQGENALVDVILLSKCTFVIRTSSNLSLWSSYLNPFLPVIHANNRH